MCLITTPSIAIADVYKWIDKEGTIHFTDEITSIPPEYQDQLNTTIKTKTENGYIEEKKTPTTYEKRFYKNTPQGPRITSTCFEEVKQGTPSILRPLCK